MSEETPGRALRTALDGMLSPSVEWTQQELATLGLIEHAADRLGADDVLRPAL